MIKKFLQLATLAIIFNFLTLATTFANNSTLPTGIKTPVEEIKSIGEGTKVLPNFYDTGQHPDAPPDYSAPGIGTATSPVYFAIDIFRYAISGIALLMVFYSAIKLISTANEEEAGKTKTTLLLAIGGLLVIQLADVVVKKMFFGEQGEAFENIATAQVYAEESVRQIRGIIGFVEVFIGVIATLVIIIRGFTVLASAGEEEALTNAKSHILYALLGLAVVALSEIVVRGVIFPEAGKELPDTELAKFIIVNIINFITMFISLLAFVALFYAGYRYVVSAGNEEENEKVKKIFLGAVIALLLSLGAFALVHTLVEFKPRYLEEQSPSQPEVTDENGQN